MTEQKRLLEAQNEADWIQRAVQGDDRAFNYLVEIYQKPIYNLCYRMLGSPQDAAQESFIRAYNALKRYDASKKFSTWLFSIANNYCIDQYRKKRVSTFSYDSLPVPDLVQRKPGIETEIMTEDRNEALMNLLGKLKPKDKAAVILKYWYDHSYEEIAETLEISVSAVKSRLHRAKKDLSGIWLDSNEERGVPIERNKYESYPIP
jgi:RNA polymerase sigma-70 factor, ECF subfamily